MSTSGYQAFAARLVETGVISDPWLDGAPRFEEEPVVLSGAEADALAAAAEDVAAALDALCRLCVAEPALLDRLGLTPVQRLLWHASAPAWHGIARADAFFVSGGEVAVCEVNCDTPSGEAEAVLLGQLAARPGLLDPNRLLLPRFLGLVERLSPRRPPAIGLVYPTEMTEDLSMIRLYAELFAARGMSVALGSPYNLGPGPGGAGVALLGQPVDVVVRHYKTDWLSERQTVWLDEEPPADDQPLDDAVSLLARAVLRGEAAVVNPLGAVVPQNKRALALLWELRDRLPPSAAAAVERHVPFTARLETLDAEPLRADKEDWVLKSDYGCEGDEVLVGAEVEPDVWSEALRQARPGRWIAQRRFVPRPGRDAVVNHGVYLVAGRASGLLTRLSPRATDARARTVATLIQEEDA